MIVWGGYNAGSYFNTGGRYDPGTNTWTATGTTNAPTGREHPTAVWTGSEMIVWGGLGNVIGGVFNTGGRYNPARICGLPPAPPTHRTPDALTPQSGPAVKWSSGVELQRRHV